MKYCRGWGRLVKYWGEEGEVGEVLWGGGG